MNPDPTYTRDAALAGLACFAMVLILGVMLRYLVADLLREWRRWCADRREKRRAAALRALQERHDERLHLAAKARRDEGMNGFCRFYNSLTK
jgi:hypothetical protein